MTEHNLFYYPYASFTNQQLPLLKVAALYFDKLVILDPVGGSGALRIFIDRIRQTGHQKRQLIPLVQQGRQ